MEMRPRRKPLMQKHIDMTGHRFGQLIVLKKAGRDKYRETLWLCQCDCKNQVIRRGSGLRNGTTYHCGCIHFTRLRNANLRHGCSTQKVRTPEWIAWNNLFQRCYNPKNPAYKYYGARGIIVCERWKESFENFLADIGPRPKGYWLERIDNEMGI